MASESTLFDCWTEPPSPLLSTRTGAFSLLAPCWQPGRGHAPCSLFASWPIAWMPSEPQPHECPYCDWSASCFVGFAFSAVAFESTLFDWATSPSSPLLSTRTGVFLFDAPGCNAPDSASASCSFLASWPMAWVPEPDWP